MMPKTQTAIANKNALKMGAMDAIYNRHAVRSYLLQAVDRSIIEELLKAATHAPTAMHEEPWAFLVVQNPEMLQLISDKAKATKQDDIRNLHFQAGSGGASHRVTPEIDVLHGAGTLIVIYGRPLGPFVEADCWLAAQNIMLAACAQGLGSCVVGMTVAALNEPNMKETLNVPAEMTAFAPIVIGYSKGDIWPSERKEPLVLGWR
jgi:nitroreductase